MLMQYNSKLKPGRVGNAQGGPLRIQRRAEARGGFCLFALLFNAVQAFCGPFPAGPSVTLAWNPSASTNVVGYNIYYGGASGVYTNSINVGNVTSAIIPGLTAGATYYFAATADDALADQSCFSNEISYPVPAVIAGLQIGAATAGGFNLTVTGPIGHSYEILATQDLTSWTVIGSVTVGAGGWWDFADTNAASFPQRFYRTYETP